MSDEYLEKKTLDEKAAEKYSFNPKHCMEAFVPMGHTGDAFLAGLKYGRRTAIEAVTKEPTNTGPTEYQPLDGTEFQEAAIKAIKARSRK